MQNPP